MTRQLSVGAALATLALAACSGSSVQQSLEPPVTSTSNPLAGSTLQFAVGTAYIAGTIGLNTVVTLRQNTGSNIGTSVLSNAPTITGPAGFKVPGLAAAPDAYGDAGTNHISAFIPTSLETLPPATTFDPNPTTQGAVSAQGNYLASSYGFFPGVVANSGLAPYLQPGPMPFYSTNNATLAGVPLEYIGGPPAFVPPGHTSAQDGTFAEAGETNPDSFVGYTLGFTDFQTPPVSGSYALSVVIPTGINQSTGVESYGSKTTAATVSSAAVLPAWATPPTFVPDGTGGGTITTNFAGGGAITEEFVELVNIGVVDPSSGSQLGALCQLSGGAPFYYTFKVTSGTATIAVPDSIGAAPPGTAQPHTFCTAADNGGTAGPGQDNWLVYGFAVDYPLLEAGFPASTGVAAPAIKSGAQDDITTSAASAGPAVDAGSIVRRMKQRSYRRH